jgi:hypothetical protein
MEHYKKVLVLAVGGGNDSVSTLLLQLELNKTFDYKPEHIDIAAVLPDCLSYHDLSKTNHKLISVINPNSSRSVNNKVINAFPEKILSSYKSFFPNLNIQNVLGISMKEGSIGILSALKYLINNQYDLILSIDVGGDFIAHKDNIEVLSPMMDGYMLYSLKELKKYIHEKNISTDMLFSIFGLGTDGESTPEMLEKAMSLIPDIKEFSFNEKNVSSFIPFYYNIVESNRYSRTTDFTLKEILKLNHKNTNTFRGRLHTKPFPEEISNIYYGNFEHYQSSDYFGKYYLFKNIDNIDNLYSKKCKNGIEWFLNVQKSTTKINHELNGQTYENIGNILNVKELNNKSLFFGTPSRKFNESQKTKINEDINLMLLNNVVDFSFIYKDYTYIIDENLYINYLNEDIALVSKSEKLNKILIEKL